MTPCNDYTGCQGGAGCTCGGASGGKSQTKKPKTDPITERLAVVEAELAKITTKEEMDTGKNDWGWHSAYLLTNEGRKNICALLREARELLR